MGTNADVSFLSGGREAVARDPAVRNGGLGGRRWPETPQSETVAWEVGLPLAVPFVLLLPVRILAAYLRLWVWSQWLLWGSICKLRCLLCI